MENFGISGFSITVCLDFWSTINMYLSQVFGELSIGAVFYKLFSQVENGAFLVIVILPISLLGCLYKGDF